jgi:hypothetical protein
MAYIAGYGVKSVKDFTIYDLQTGAILRIGCCSEDDFSHQCKAGEGIIEGHVDHIELTHNG